MTSTEVSGRRNRLDYLLISGLVAFGSVGAFKGIPAVDTVVPVDLTALAAGGAIFVLLVRLRRTSRSAGGWIVLVWGLAFLPGVLVGLVDVNQDLYKVGYLYSITLLAALATAWVTTSTLRRAWAYAVLGLGGLMAVAVWLVPDIEYATEFGRSNVLGGTTITAARVMCAGAVVGLLMIATGVIRGWSRQLLVTAGCIALIVTSIQVGSRGPVIALLLAVPFCLLFARASVGGRVRNGAAAGLFAMGLFYVIAVTGSSAAQRIFSVFEGAVDYNRNALTQFSIGLIRENAWGVGWGGFGREWGAGSAGFEQSVHPHNLGLELLVENGFLGAAATSALIFLALYGGWRRSADPSVCVMWGSAFYWLCNALVSSDINGNRELWQTLVLLVACTTVGSSEVGASISVQKKSRHAGP